MNKQQLIEQIKLKKSFLCVGLDTDVTKIPVHLRDLEDPIFEFNRQIIDATQDKCVAYKPNIAFYESQGSKGWLSLERTIEYINTRYPEIFTIADAKRGDIGNTSSMYAHTFFQNMPFHSVTVAPYMGSDSVKPFLGCEGKWVILLALTSNQGAFDFQTMLTKDNMAVYEHVIETSKTWGTSNNMMYVVGATKAEKLADIRQLLPNHFLLVPGVGAQGGSLQDVANYGMNADCGLLVNASRSIIYASTGTDFAEKAAEEAAVMQVEMEELLRKASII